MSLPQEVRKISFTAVSSLIGLVSGVLGIIQAMKEMGRSLIGAFWDGLFYLGCIALASWVSLLLVGGLLATARAKMTGKGTVEEHLRTYVVLVPVLIVGSWAGIALAEANPVQFTRPYGDLGPRVMQPLLPPGLMRLIGALAIVAPIAAYFAQPASKEETPPTPVEP